ncbi:glycosyl hydrolase family 95 catalytic domain-containing protein [Catalinimonas alkaloidigena]|nr:glycoside hydrolase family 95 protein [Catalinimonas alkaloidigena]
MRCLVATLVAGLFLLCSGCSTVQDTKTPTEAASAPLKLWYNTPAADWNEALPLGNGRLGVMLFGGAGQERLQLNEETVWAGEPGNNLIPALKGALPDIRRLLFEGKYQEAQDLGNRVLPRHPTEDNNYGMPYQTVGNVFLEFPGHENPTDYYRDLDIGTAVASVSYRVGDVQYRREVFASFPDDVIVVRLEADRPGSLTFNVRVETPQKTHQVQTAGQQLVLSGTSGRADNKTGQVAFQALVQPQVEGGQVVTTDSALQIQGADAATLYLSVGTNFNNYHDLTGNAAQRAADRLQAAQQTPYPAAKAAHSAYYRKFFDRVSLDLGTTDSLQKPTDERLREFATGHDPGLVSLYFQYGRYLLISSSQPGGQPANLQGIWNDQLFPPWDSKYTININTEMNYWPAEVTHLPEMHEPLFAMLKELSVTGQESATQMYGARGWAVHHNTDVWRITGPVDGAYYGLWPMGGAWLSQHLWQRYLFSGDEAFLRDVYPLLKGAATFYVDVLQEEPSHHWLVVAPSMSPENSHPHGGSMAAGTTMDNQLVFDVFSNLIQAAGILNRDATFVDTVQARLDRLPPMQIGRWGQLQEWMQDWDREDDKHRHISHLYGLYPSNQISPLRHPDLFAAAHTSLVARGDKSTGWSMGWKVNFWARLLDGNRAYRLIQDQLSPAGQGEGEHGGGTYPNLLDAHPPFQIDGNFGCTAGIAEMLVQSHDGAVQLLPALPDAWPQGTVTGLRARGGFTLDELTWSDGNVERLVVTSNLGGVLRLRTTQTLQAEEGTTLNEATGENPNPFYRTAAIKTPLVADGATTGPAPTSDTRLYEVETEKGKRYVFTRTR